MSSHCNDLISSASDKSSSRESVGSGRGGYVCEMDSLGPGRGTVAFLAQFDAIDQSLRASLLLKLAILSF